MMGSFAGVCRNRLLLRILLFRVPLRVLTINKFGLRGLGL